MKKAAWSVLVALALVGSAAPAAAQLPCNTTTGFTGGSSFATTMSGCLTYEASTGVLTLTITNVGSGAGEVFAAIGLVNVGGLASPGSPVSPTGRFTWERTQQFTADGNAILPPQTWAWVANSSPSRNGLQPGESGTFRFVVSPSVYTDNIGWGVHAISGPAGCSTKFAVWNGGSAQTVPQDDAESVACRSVSVPEPGSMALLATGLAGLAFVAARRRNGLLDEEGDDA